MIIKKWYPATFGRKMAHEQRWLRVKFKSPNALSPHALTVFMAHEDYSKYHNKNRLSFMDKRFSEVVL